MTLSAVIDLGAAYFDDISRSSEVHEKDGYVDRQHEQMQPKGKCN
jgi:hypothetical protein